MQIDQIMHNGPHNAWIYPETDEKEMKLHLQ